MFEPDSTPYLIGFKWIVPFIGHIKHDCNCGLKTVLCRRLPEAVLFLVQAVGEGGVVCDHTARPLA